jgi:hypothetical protein
MKSWRAYLASALFAWCLSFGGVGVEAAVHKRRGCDAATLRHWHDQSELRRDEKEFESDLNSLRRLLQSHATSERISRLRFLVRQDWAQIVMDRGQSRLCHAEAPANLAAGRDSQKFINRPRLP